MTWDRKGGQWGIQGVEDKGSSQKSHKNEKKSGSDEHSHSPGARGRHTKIGVHSPIKGKPA